MRHSPTKIDFDMFSRQFEIGLLSKRKKSCGCNYKPHLSKELRKTVKVKPRLINKVNKTKSDVDIAAYKKQGIYVVFLNQKSELF